MCCLLCSSGGQSTPACATARPAWPAPPPAQQLALPGRPCLLSQERQRLTKLLEQVDEDRQQLQREKAEMVGELVLLRAAAEAPPADATMAGAAPASPAAAAAGEESGGGVAQPGEAAAAQQAQQEAQELARQLAEAQVGCVRCAALCW